MFGQGATVFLNCTDGEALLDDDEFRIVHAGLSAFGVRGLGWFQLIHTTLVSVSGYFRTFHGPNG